MDKKFKRGVIREWDKITKRGRLEEYPKKANSAGIFRVFTEKNWEDEYGPEVDGHVHFVLDDNGRLSRVCLINFEPWKSVRGPGRMYLDARAWLDTAKQIHQESAQSPMPEDLRSVFGQMERHVISFRGSLVKYCYGLAIELYLKWLLSENNIGFEKNHKLSCLIPLLPNPIATRLRDIYSDFYAAHRDGFRFMEIDTEGIREVRGVDWSTFDSFAENLEVQRFLMSRYATPQDYSVFRSRFGELSVEMNRYIDSLEFFHVASRIISFVPGYTSGDDQFPRYGVTATVVPR